MKTETNIKSQSIKEENKCEICGEEIPENYCCNCGIYVCNSCFDKLDGGDNWKFCPKCVGEIHK